MIHSINRNVLDIKLPCTISVIPLISYFSGDLSNLINTYAKSKSESYQKQSP